MIDLSLWLQNLLVALLVAGCGAFILWQLVQTLRGRGSAIGCNCKSCPSSRPAQLQRPRVVFLPVESLRRRR